MRWEFVVGLSILVVVILGYPVVATGSAWIHHDLAVKLEPANQRMVVTDRVTLPERALPPAGTSFMFHLHPGLDATSPTPGVLLSQKDSVSWGSSHEDPLVETYRVNMPRGRRSFELRYEGRVHHSIEAHGEDYARSYGRTPGIISPEGVFLSPGSGWYPVIGNDLITFTLDVELPRGWGAVSQGERTQQTQEENRSCAHWESPEPQEGIYLVAGQFHEYARQVKDDITAMVFLRAPDEKLAGRYLDATDQYLAMYGDLIGPYPYRKFALVENFWETGYGMPSFTLLGRKVVRFPFIIYSSYPHEILHNWWANGVYVDFDSGNWCEGLTAYLSDHLIQEQRGNGAGHRQRSLQKYTDYVTQERDLPLRDFRSRHGSATEAIGYTKMMMFCHMLRLDLGDRTFIQALKRFYQDNLFRVASFDELNKAFEAVSKRDLSAEFSQWVERSGAPELRVRDKEVVRRGTEYSLTLRLEQVQNEPPFRLRIPLAVTLEGDEQGFQTSIFMVCRKQDIKLRFSARPLRVDVDPEFDVFRRLDRHEISPAMSQPFGASRVSILLPAQAPSSLLKAYKQLADSWARSQGTEVEIKRDNDVTRLPADCTVWLFGWENRFVPELSPSLRDYGASADGEGVRLASVTYRRRGHSVALATRHPVSSDEALAWFAVDNASAVSDLGRRLPHFHRYSYLVFEATAGTNVTKGRWPVVNSPMTILLPDEAGEIRSVEMAKLSPRAPLGLAQE